MTECLFNPVTRTCLREGCHSAVHHAPGKIGVRCPLDELARQAREDAPILEPLEARFLDGDRSAVAEAALYCRRNNRAYPQWVVRHVLNTVGRYIEGAIHTPDIAQEMFGTGATGRNADPASKLQADDEKVRSYFVVRAIQDAKRKLGVPYPPGATAFELAARFLRNGRAHGTPSAATVKRHHAALKSNPPPTTDGRACIYYYATLAAILRSGGFAVLEGGPCGVLLGTDVDALIATMLDAGDHAAPFNWQARLQPIPR